jgi:hypothetical protein
VREARAGLRAWFADLRDDPSLIEASHFLQGLAKRWADEDAPVTDDSTQTPRIELRGKAPDELFGLVIAGVPVKFGDQYITKRLAFFFEDGEVHGLPTGRLCYDCVVPGLSKHLVLK